MSTNNSYTLVGSNEDYKKSHSQVFFIPPQDRKYGHALFGYNGSVQSGINEKGLFWDGLRAYPYVKAPMQGDKADIGGNVLYKILEDCATVDEVIRLFETYQWEGFSLSQLMVVDKTGESAIVTHGKNGLVVTKKDKHYQLCTNFRIAAQADAHNYNWYNIGSGRYRKAEKLLQAPDLTVDKCFAILKATHQNNPFAKTIYSSVFNLNTGDIHLCVNGKFSQLTTINLHQQLTHGKCSYFLSDLTITATAKRRKIEIIDENYLTINSGRLLLDTNWQPTLKEHKAAYYRMVENDSVAGRYVMKDYFMNDTLQGITSYSSLVPEIMDGKYAEYHMNGQLRASGYFRHRLKQGEWRYWNEEGQLQKTLKYVDGVQQNLP